MVFIVSEWTEASRREGGGLVEEPEEETASSFKTRTQFKLIMKQRNVDI